MHEKYLFFSFYVVKKVQHFFARALKTLPNCKENTRVHLFRITIFRRFASELIILILPYIYSSSARRKTLFSRSSEWQLYSWYPYCWPLFDTKSNYFEFEISIFYSKKLTNSSWNNFPYCQNNVFQRKSYIIGLKRVGEMLFLFQSF